MSIPGDPSVFENGADTVPKYCDSSTWAKYLPDQNVFEEQYDESMHSLQFSSYL